MNKPKPAPGTSSKNSLEDKVNDWLYGFLHSPASYDGRTSQEIIKSEIEEARAIFKRELAKRKANESMKNLITKDDIELRYWLVEKAGHKKIKILLHGSGGNFAKADRAISLLDRGYNVAMISYRGHSGNPGKADQKTIINDVKETILNIMQQTYTMSDIHLEASSLGTSVIAHVLKRIYQEALPEEEFASLILKAAPLNLKDRDQETLDSLKAAGINESRAEPLLRKIWNQEDAYSKIRASEITIVHGTHDDVVPVEHAKKIKAILDRNNQNVILKIIDGEGHQLNLNQYGVY
jgi:pimeloyl-ACP methyl ester carboxylesterase